jgi:hypothetical protein
MGAGVWIQGPMGMVLLSVFVWSVALDLVAVAGARLIDPRPELGRGALTATWQQWDANWYERIVAYGYDAIPDAIPGHAAIYLQTAFYPGFPLIARAVFDLIHPIGVGITGAMLLTNQALVFIMAFLFYSMTVALTNSSEVGVRAVRYLLLFPFAYFLLAPYSETAFLTFVAGFIWAFTTRRYMAAGLWGAAASATRLIGVVLPLILVISYLEQHDWDLRSLRPRIVVSCVIPFAGTGAYALYQWVQFGSPLYSQTASYYGWARSFTLDLWHEMSQSFTHPYLSAGSIHGVAVETFVTLPLLAGFAALTTAVWRRFGVALGLMCVLFIMIPITSGSLLSFDRYTLPLLPCFVVLAIWGRSSMVDFAYRTVGSLFLALFLIMFTHGVWTG